MQVSYDLGGRMKTEKFTSALVWADTKSIEGVKIWARDERNGEYVRVYEVAPDEFVQHEVQSWTRGNFETVEAAKAMAGKAYRYLNRGRK